MTVRMEVYFRFGKEPFTRSVGWYDEDVAVAMAQALRESRDFSEVKVVKEQKPVEISF